MRELEKELRKIDIMEGALGITTANEEMRKVKTWDEKEWQKVMNKKENLCICRKWRTELRDQEKVYNNRSSSVLLFKCRTNNLSLNDRNRFKGQEKMCDLSDNDKGDLINFILWYPACVKTEMLKATTTYEEDEKNITLKFLFNVELVRETKEIIQF